MTPAIHAVAQFSALRVVDSLVEGSLIALFAALVVRLPRRQNAGTRFAVWFAALIGIAAVPFLGAGSLFHRGISAATPGPSAITIPESWALYLFLTWAVIAAWQFAGVGRALWHLHVLRKSCEPVDPATLDPLLRETLQRSRTHRRVLLCTSDFVRVPTAIGLLKPAVVIPRWVMRELSPEEVNQILLHELAHLTRWDDWTNLAQQLVKVVFFFHPAVWWIERKVGLEREMACDDAVLAETASPRAYAECLAHLAERSFVERSVALAQAALGKIHQTSLRVAQILDVNRPAGPARRPVVSLVAAFAIACAAFAARSPKLIAFQENDSTREAATSQTIAAATPDVENDLNFRRLPIVNLSARTPVRPLPVTQAKLTIASDRRNPVAKHRTKDGTKPKEVLLTSNAKSSADNLIHRTSVAPAALPITETVFFVIQSAPTSDGYQIQMWQVMVLREVVPPASRIPRKET